MSAIRLLLPEGRLQRWHATLFDVLVRDGHRVAVDLRVVNERPRTALLLLEQLERLLYERGRASSCDAIPSGEWTSGSEISTDITFDLTGAAEPAEGAIAPLYDGRLGDVSRDLALLDGRAPEIALALVSSKQLNVLVRGRPAIERPQVFVRGTSAVADRIATLIRGVARRRMLQSASTSVQSHTRDSKPLAFVLQGIASAARRRLAKLVSREGHWRIGWRSLDGIPGVIEAQAWPSGVPWRWLRDDGRRYFADPFLFRENGTTYVFCEEFPYATAKGVISVFTLDASGQPSAARVALEQPYHLSYPQVFRHDGRIWMMPESSANRTLELYVAESFPDRWKLHSVLMTDLSLSDATAFEHDGRWWLTATTNEPHTSTWDCLSLFSSPSPVGPWSRSGDLPVLIDASAARPAGQVVRRGGALWRPAQDCTRSYGSGLALCRIDELSDGVLRQSVVRRLGPPTGAPDQGVHTLNSDEKFEVIDAVGQMARASWFGGRDAA
jgi:hypothetical protein